MCRAHYECWRAIVALNLCGQLLCTSVLSAQSQRRKARAQYEQKLLTPIGTPTTCNYTGKSCTYLVTHERAECARLVLALLRLLKAQRTTVPRERPANFPIAAASETHV